MTATRSIMSSVTTCARSQIACLAFALLFVTASCSREAPGLAFSVRRDDGPPASAFVGRAAPSAAVETIAEDGLQVTVIYEFARYCSVTGPSDIRATYATDAVELVLAFPRPRHMTPFARDCLDAGAGRADVTLVEPVGGREVKAMAVERPRWRFP